MFDEDCVRLGARIRELRTAKGWRQIDLGQHTGIHEVHISDIERGATEIGFKRLVAIAKAFGVSLSVLCDRV
ncbi:MAG: helix-turn-helix domain-containing protein [Janthinobacterium lividum]